MVSLSVIGTHHYRGGPGPLWAIAPWGKKFAGLLNKPERIMTSELGKTNTTIKGAGTGSQYTVWSAA